MAITEAVMDGSVCTKLNGEVCLLMSIHQKKKKSLKEIANELL